MTCFPTIALWRLTCKITYCKSNCKNSPKNLHLILSPNLSALMLIIECIIKLIYKHVPIFIWVYFSWMLELESAVLLYQWEKLFYNVSWHHDLQPCHVLVPFFFLFNDGEYFHSALGGNHISPHLSPCVHKKCMYVEAHVTAAVYK